ncbi:hypothetical protein HELRODRAFT_163438 [Helobdella robusta]|uniref:RING-type E3 ubiquitin transferase n=1 Tax=Helobdella robusta TaxID=6412 RepID=T1EU18_HELRO|nr:hypothetical protein HELRODRAFT_163438 [Helobdella robusta]ESN96380.1 hypothetical protein HELRODRAFT_163438 [Helobdella robusta]
MPESEKKSTSSSGIDQCSICVSNIEAKVKSVFSWFCFHEFCFSCIKELSKKDAVCPLCNQKFTEILQSIQSNAEPDARGITRNIRRAKRKLNKSDHGKASMNSKDTSNGSNVQQSSQSSFPTATTSFTNNSIISGQSVVPYLSLSWATSPSNDYGSCANNKITYSSYVDEGSRN